MCFCTIVFVHQNIIILYLRPGRNSSREIHKNGMDNLKTRCHRPSAQGYTNSTRHKYHHISQLRVQTASLPPNVATANNCRYRAAPLQYAHRETHLQCVCGVCTCLTNVLFLCCLDLLSSAIYLGAWRHHLLFGQWMVLSGKPPDYKQRGNSNKSNSSVAMETRSRLFDTYGCHSVHMDFCCCC